NSVTCRYYVSTSGGFSGNNDVSAKVFSNGALIGSPILGSQNNVAFDIPLGTSIEVKFSVNNSWYFGPSTITLKDNAMAIVGTASESHPGGQVSMEKTVINVTATCALPYSVTYSWSPAAGLASPGSQTTIASPVVNTNYEATIEMTSSPFCKVKTNTVNVRAGCIPLPVDWLYFNANKFLGDKAILDWGTANEVNVAYFSVERSFDGVQFQSIGVVNATVKGGQNKYQFIDADPLKGHNYYRIRQVDSDGQNHFTDIRFIDFSSSWDVVVYPNSSIDYFTVQLVNAFDMESELSVFNLLGHEIEYHSLNADVHTIAIGSNWEVGVYILKVIQGNEQKIIKLIKEGE
ncbi:MAG TPA: T9SS type A sorting domain-containing protein, partial [Cytophagaceae bacterium]